MNSEPTVVKLCMSRAVNTKLINSVERCGPVQ